MNTIGDWSTETYEVGEEGSAGAQFETGEFLRFVTGVLGVEEFGEQKFTQFGTFAEDGRIRQRRAEEINAVPGRHVDAVPVV